MKKTERLKELRSLSVNELVARARELKEELFHLRIKHASGQLEKPHLFGLYRSDIARCETLLAERKNAARKQKSLAAVPVKGEVAEAKK